MENKSEKQRQENFPWQRSKYHANYNSILGYYKVVSCIENVNGGSLLDLACGDGNLTQHFVNHFDSIVGVDASSKHLAVAKEKVSDATFHESLIEEFQTTQKFDAVFLLDVLEHVIDPGVLLEKAASFLKPSGKIIVHVPNENAVNRRIAVLMGTLTSVDELSPFDLNVAGHRRSYNLNSLVKEFDNAGLTISKTGGIFYKMLSTPQMDWFLTNGEWESGHGWGRTGMEKSKDWREEFCRACYEYGKERPEDCNIIYACATL